VSVPTIRAMVLAGLLVAVAAGPAGAALCGDTDDNNQLTITDGVAVLRAGAGLSSPCTLTLCDVDGSGAITVTDGVLVLRAAAGLGGPLTCDQTPRDSCLAAVRAGNLDAAAAVCAKAAPGDGAIQAIADGSRTLVELFGDSQLNGILTGLGIQRIGSPTNICDLRAVGSLAPPGAPRTGSIESILRSRGLQLIDQLLSNTADTPTSVNVEFSCPDLAAQGAVVEVDFGDLLIVRYQLNIQAAMIHIAAAYDVDFDPAGRLKFEDVFVGNPSLFTLNGGVGAAELGLARQRLDEALGDFLAALDFILAESDDQSNDLFSIDPTDRDVAARQRAAAIALRAALNGTGILDASLLSDLPHDQRVSFDALFDGRLTKVRSLVPGFNDDRNVDLCQVSDPTFGGIFPDLEKGPGGCVDQDDVDPFENHFGPSTKIRNIIRGEDR
jgi:hypothetical protein